MEDASGIRILVIAEKPDAAYHIATALDSQSKEIKTYSWRYWLAHRNGLEYVVCPASGHLYDMGSRKGSSSIYPVFDVFWKESKSKTQNRIFRSLSKGANKLVVACDYDIEGDTIGYNVIKYACLADPSVAFRARFSTLTPDDILSAFDSIEQTGSWPMAMAGRARHLVDFIWGVNASRALSLSASPGHYSKLSLGRVQGPTLNYIYERNKEKNLHLPMPYWKIYSAATVDDQHLQLEYEEACKRKMETEVIKNTVEHKNGIVDNVIKNRFVRLPAPAFNLSDLQHEAYEILHMNPSTTLKIAESLYLDALISYPRTNSQKLPASINLNRILRGLSANHNYESYIQSLVNRKPVQGKRDDPAHPAIFPTGLQPVNLDRERLRLYDLIVRRFLASFSKPCIKEKMHIEVMNGPYRFFADFERTIYLGFLYIYNFRNATETWPKVELKKGSTIKFDSVSIDEGYTQPPPSYNPASLLSKMERDEIGTKATRSDIIDLLYKRRYINGQTIHITDLGMGIIEIAKQSYPKLISIETTRELEKDLSEIEKDPKRYNDVVLQCAYNVFDALEMFETNKISFGNIELMQHASLLANKNLLGKCPVCGTGSLVIIKSRKSGKRFVGCTNYTKGCHASAPLPQRGSINYKGNACKECGWPIVLVFFPRRRYPWRICINMKCPRKLQKMRLETKPKS